MIGYLEYLFTCLPFVFWAGVIDFLEIHAHSSSWGFTRSRFLGYHDYWAGPRVDAFLDDSCTL